MLKIIDKKIVCIVLFFLLFTILISNVNATDDYISNPSNIPKFSYIKNPEIKQGGQGEISFTIKNRYNMSIEEITLTINIYILVTKSSSINITDIEQPPKINENNALEITYNWNKLLISSNKFISFNISAEKDTPIGSYFLRSMLEFKYNGTKYLMKSRGYITDEEWDKYSKTNNISSIEIDGIIPDTGFKVIENIKDKNGNFIAGFDLSLCVIALMIILLIFRKKL